VAENILDMETIALDDAARALVIWAWR